MRSTSACATARGRSAWRSTSACGCRRYLSGSGKAMLALLPPDEVRRLFAGGLRTRLTRKGPRDVDALLKELALTRQRGYSVDDEGGARGRAARSARRCSTPSGAAVAGVAVCINKALLGADRGARYRRLAARRRAQRCRERLGGASVALGAASRAPPGAHAQRSGGSR